MSNTIAILVLSILSVLFYLKVVLLNRANKELENRENYIKSILDSKRY